MSSRAKFVNLGSLQPNSASPVCVYSFHPLVLSQFERLCQGHFELIAVRLDPTQGSPLGDFTVPSARVYIVEANARTRTTCAIVEEVLARRQGARILVAAEKFDEEDAFRLLRLGAKGLLHYAEVRDLLVRAVTEMSTGGFWVPRSLLSRFVDHTLVSFRSPRRMGTVVHLSRREQEVHRLVMENLSNKEIASQLHMSERTVKFHVSNLLGKHGVKRRADLILLSFTEKKHA